MTSESASFNQFALNKQLLSAVEELGYESPTEVQVKAIPPILSGNHVLGIAQTGTGKTAAYLLPILMKLKYAQGDEPRALILVPTRELVLQVTKAVEELSKFTDLRVVGLYGGIGPTKQIREVQVGVDIIVATPGRFLDIYSAGHIVVKKIQVMVMDEADRLMDMGFIKQIQGILEVVRQKKQCLLFSATMSDLVKKIAGDFLEFPVTIQISPDTKTASTVSQCLYLTPNIKTKVNLVLNFLKQPEFTKTIIFARSRQNAETLFKILDHKLIAGSVRVIHGNKGQNNRINTIEEFKQGDVKVLIATDVAARGLDVVSVSHVINFEVPINYDDYIHRIGRTGRAFQTGASITFANPAEEYHVRKIEKLIQQVIPIIPIDELLISNDLPYEEKQAMAKELDHQKRKENPDFKGAFHEKKHNYDQPKKVRYKGDKRGQMRGRKTKG